MDAFLEALTDLDVLALFLSWVAMGDGGGFAGGADEDDDDDDDDDGDAVADSNAVAWAGFTGPMNPWISGMTNAGSMGAGSGDLMATLANALATSVRGLAGNVNFMIVRGRS